MRLRAVVAWANLLLCGHSVLRLYMTLTLAVRLLLHYLGTPRERRRNIKWVIAGFAWLLVFVTACSAGPAASSPSVSASSPPGKTPTVSHAVVPQVKNPWHPGMPQLGINVYWLANAKDPADVINAKARRIINYAIGLNANSIVLSFPFYTYSITSNALYASVQTPSPAHIALFLKEAAASGVRVTLRPILNEDNLVVENPNAWRGDIEPTDPGAWFTSYQQLLMPYATVAAAGHAETFVVGTELNSVEQDPRWPALIQNIRSVFTGELAYDENFDEFQQKDANLPVPVFGVDAYPRFQLTDSATVDQLSGAWEQWLSTHTLAVRERTILSEVGITPVAGSYSDPGHWYGVQQDPIMPIMQSRWFNAVCDAASAEHLGGLYWWEIDFDADPANPVPFQSNKITFLGRPAQQQVQACFARLSTGNG
jgi:hypothetical protein